MLGAFSELKFAGNKTCVQWKQCNFLCINSTRKKEVDLKLKFFVSKTLSYLCDVLFILVNLRNNFFICPITKLTQKQTTLCTLLLKTN